MTALRLFLVAYYCFTRLCFSQVDGKFSNVSLGKIQTMEVSAEVESVLRGQTLVGFTVICKNSSQETPYTLIFSEMAMPLDIVLIPLGAPAKRSNEPSTAIWRGSQSEMTLSPGDRSISYLPLSVFNFSGGIGESDAAELLIRPSCNVAVGARGEITSESSRKSFPYLKSQVQVSSEGALKGYLPPPFSRKFELSSNREGTGVRNCGSVAIDGLSVSASLFSTDGVSAGIVLTYFNPSKTHAIEVRIIEDFALSVKTSTGRNITLRKMHSTEPGMYFKVGTNRKMNIYVPLSAFLLSNEDMIDIDLFTGINLNCEFAVLDRSNLPISTQRKSLNLEFKEPVHQRLTTISQSPYVGAFFPFHIDMTVE